ncbi:MAG: hypothetical protein ACYDCC_15135 [Actinomycetota bacterium]
MKLCKSRLIPALIAIAVVAATTASYGASGSFAFSRNVLVSKIGGNFSEPSGISAPDGTRFIAYQGGKGGSNVAKAAPGHAFVNTGYDAFNASGNPTGNIGDVTTVSDQAGTIYVGHLNGNLNADIDYSTDGGSTWSTAHNVLGDAYNASLQPLGVDRPWMAVYSPTKNVTDTKIYLEYHDFGPSAMWMVSCSMAMGYLSCGVSHPVSGAESECSTMPGPTMVAPRGSPHAGRVYAVWLASDPALSGATGCNVTELAPAYSVYIAYSDNADSTASTWKLVNVFTGPNMQMQCSELGTPLGSCDDNGNIFPHLTVDRAGNVYVGWVGYISTLDPHYDVYISSSTDGGDTFSSTPHRVNPTTGYEVMPALVAGDSGRLAVAWVGTDFDTQPYTSQDTCPANAPFVEHVCAGKPKPQPASAAWRTYVAESLDATSNHPTFKVAQASDAIIDYGDFCTIGIYCDGSSSGNRSLLDNISIFIDDAGYVQVAWTDNRLDPHLESDAASANAQSLQGSYSEIFASCQISGPSLYVHPRSGPSCARVLGRKLHKGKHAH